MSTVEVRYVSKKTVQSATNSTAAQRIHLTPWDIVALPVAYIQKGLLFHKPQLKTEEKTLFLNQLFTSFSRTLDYFYPLTGRLAIETNEDETATVFLSCNNTGAEFIHASADLSVSDILDPLYVPRIVHSFFPLNNVINHDGLSQPLLAVQVTELVDGMFIGCTMNHAVCDGTFFWHFINSWSAICRDLNHIPRPPVLERWFLNESDCPIRLSAASQDQFIENFTPPPFQERFFSFSPQNIAKLKAKANREQDTTKISSLQALIGHIWIAVTRARCLDPDQEVVYKLLTGNRARLNPKLPEEYFGNSVQVVVAKAKAGELLKRGLGWAAWLLNQAIAAHDEAAIITSWENWMKKPVFISHSKDIGAFILITGSSPRFNMYGNDFGWGKPIAVRSGCGNKADRKLTVYQGAVEGGIDFEVCISPKTLLALGNDREFMEAVTVMPPFGSV